MTGRPVCLSLAAMCFLYTGAVSAASVVINDAWVAKNGSVVTGTYTGTASTPAISVTTTKPITIQNATVSGPGNLISLGAGTQATVINTYGSGTNPNVNGQFKGSFITGSSVASLLMQNCTVEGVYFGIYLYKFSGNTSAGQTIRILKNVFNNIDGRPSDGKGGYQMSGFNSHSHAIQLNGVQAVPGTEIAWNQAISVPYQSLVSDVINIYSSSGTSASHLRVHDNYVQGPMGPQPGNGEKYSGGGIITDGKSADTVATATAWVDIYNNQVNMTGNYGVAVAAGHDNNIYNNRVVSSGFLSDGTYYAMSFANAANNGNLQNQTTSVYYNNHVHDNVLGLIRKNSSGVPVRSDWWLPGQTSTENNLHLLPNTSTSPTVQSEQAEWTTWRNRLVSNGIQVGVQSGVQTGTLSLAASGSSDAACNTASDTLYLDGSTTGTVFQVSQGVRQTLATGAHTLALASATKPVSGSGGGTCVGTLSANKVTIAAGQTSTLSVTWKYTAPVQQGTVALSAASESDTRCLSATDTVYFDGASSGTAWLVSSGVSSVLSAGSHALSLASGSAGIPAGSGQTGTCSSVLSASSVTVAAGQTVTVNATYHYNSASTAACTITKSVVNSVQTWDVKVDGFHEEVSLSGFPVDANGNIAVSGVMTMKNDFKINFWSSQGFSSTVSGKTGTFSGNLYGKSGSGSFTLDGYLTDGTPVVMNLGDVPMQSLSINGIACVATFLSR